MRKLPFQSDDWGAISQTRGRFSFSHTTWSIAQITLHRSGLPVIIFCYIIQLNICVTEWRGNFLGNKSGGEHKAQGNRTVGVNLLVVLPSVASLSLQMTRFCSIGIRISTYRLQGGHSASMLLGFPITVAIVKRDAGSYWLPKARNMSTPNTNFASGEDREMIACDFVKWIWHGHILGVGRIEIGLATQEAYLNIYGRLKYLHIG